MESKPHPNLKPSLGFQSEPFVRAISQQLRITVQLNHDLEERNQCFVAQHVKAGYFAQIDLAVPRRQTLSVLGRPGLRPSGVRTSTAVAVARVAAIAVSPGNASVLREGILISDAPHQQKCLAKVLIARSVQAIGFDSADSRKSNVPSHVVLGTHPPHLVTSSCTILATELTKVMISSPSLSWHRSKECMSAKPKSAYTDRSIVRSAFGSADASSRKEEGGVTSHTARRSPLLPGTMGLREAFPPPSTVMLLEMISAPATPKPTRSKCVMRAMAVCTMLVS